MVLPRTDDEALTETRLLLAGTLGDVTPGAELYFCGVLVVTKMVGDSRTVGEALGEDSGVPVRLREISVPGKPSGLEYEKTVFDEVQAAAQQLFEDGSREPDRGATLAQLMDWSAALALQPTDSATSAEASEPEPEQVEPEQIEPEEVEQEGAEQDEVEQDGAEREERSWPRFQLVSRWRRKPKPQAADQTFSATDEARLAYLLILADGTTPPTAWQRCRSIVRDFDKAVAKEEKARGYQLRLLAGGDSVVAQSALRPAGEADRRDLKAPASSYIDLARVISDVEVMLDETRTAGVVLRRSPYQFSWFWPRRRRCSTPTAWRRRTPLRCRAGDLARSGRAGRDHARAVADRWSDLVTRPFRDRPRARPGPSRCV